jgi:hypothetical protein
MRKRFKSVFFDCVAAMGMAVGFCPLATGAPCSAGFVVLHHHTFTVLPTGVDDTANLQCAFDSAVAAGPSAVQLEEGTYHIRQIVVNNFKGSFTGAGAQQSVLTNLPNLYVTPVNMYYQAPSAANPWPSLVSFVGGDFQVSDMGIRITGATPTTGWTIFGLPTLYSLAHGFVVLGTSANASFSRVDIEGVCSSKPVCDYALSSLNLFNGIYYEGFIGSQPPPISGSFLVHDSTFRHLGSAVPVANVANASVLISRTNSQDVLDAMDVFGMISSRYQFSFNTVQGLYGGYVYDEYLGTQATEGVTSSEILMANNVFSGQYGVYLDGTFKGGTTCQVLGNNFPNVTVLGIYLGVGTSHCLVAGNSPTTIENLGTDNVVFDKDLVPKSMASLVQMLRPWGVGSHR